MNGPASKSLVSVHFKTRWSKLNLDAKRSRLKNNGIKSRCLMLSYRYQFKGPFVHIHTYARLSINDGINNNNKNNGINPFKSLHSTFKNQNNKRTRKNWRGTPWRRIKRNQRKFQQKQDWWKKNCLWPQHKI